ncbi:MAG: hypothetical protein R3Y29_04050 [bacterium]
MFIIKNKIIPRTIRFTDSLFETLTILATKNNISFNSLVIQCCEYALDNMYQDDKDIKNN